jgi:hypothetical protein
MYEVVLARKEKNGIYRQVFHAVDKTPWRAKEIAVQLKLFRTYMDGNREQIFSDLDGKYKMYVTRIDRWW